MCFPGRSRLLRLAAVIAVLPASAGMAHAAAAIYQCGPGQYSERPCSGGTRYMPSQPIREPSAQERKAAMEVARREKQLAHDLQAQRERDERQAARRGAANLSPPSAHDTAAGAKPGRKDKPTKQPPGSASKKSRQHAAQRAGDFTAVSPR